MKAKLYFGERISHISVNEIKNKIKQNIINYTNWINRYVEVINALLDDSFKLNINSMLFDIKREYDESSAYENDGNTNCEGFSYNVIWAYPIGNSTSDEWYIRQKYAEKFLYFVYEDQERVYDNKTQLSRFFSIYLAGIKLPREDNHIIRIDYNNNNYGLDSVLNKGNIVSIVLKIQELQKKYELLKQLEYIELFKEEK